MRRALALAAALLLAGCTGSSEQKLPQPFGTRAATAVLKDALLLSAVKAALVATDPDSATTVGVGARDGVVTLRGRVHDAKTRTRLVTAARQNSGVVRVVDQLKVDPRSPLLRQQVGDVALAARVETAITAQLGPQSVGVRVERGVATLTGTVHDRKTKATVLAAARGTSGIRNVVDRIRVGTP
ncbi:MAG TPA: BON domain-containing protein [Candidatus Elarobacter sp.]|jgi:osmotically-inducible protein OsmY|nr:BON domain-containing protein [Candidatus Elarobacter sp.]